MSFVSSEVSLEVGEGKRILFNLKTKKGARRLLKQYERLAFYRARDWFIKDMSYEEIVQHLRVQIIEAAQYYAGRELGSILDRDGKKFKNKGTFDKMVKIQFDNVLKELRRKANNTIKRGRDVQIVSLDKPIVKEGEGRALTFHDILPSPHIRTGGGWKLDETSIASETIKRITDGTIELDEQFEIKKKLKESIAFSGTRLELYEFRHDTDLLAEQIKKRLGLLFEEVFLLKRAGLSQKSIANLLQIERRVRCGDLKENAKFMTTSKEVLVVVKKDDKNVVLQKKGTNNFRVVDASDVIVAIRNRTEGGISQLVDGLRNEKLIREYFGIVSSKKIIDRVDRLLDEE